MNFTPNQVGLTNQVITDEFEKKRGNCWHSGIDISSRKNGRPTNLPFTAGIWGRVLNLGGKQNSITIRPITQNNIYIQYLHCETHSVSIGQLVAPWTIMGTTGERGNSNGIHLHLHIVKERETPKYPCWTRQFLNPSTFNIVNPLIGTWYSEKNRRYTKVINGTTYTYLEVRRGWQYIKSTSIGDTYEFIVQSHIRRSPNTWECTRTGKWQMKIVAQFDNLLEIARTPLGCSQQGGKGCKCKQNNDGKTIKIRLRDKSSFEYIKGNGNPAVFKKTNGILQVMPELNSSIFDNEAVFVDTDFDDEFSFGENILWDSFFLGNETEYLAGLNESNDNIL